MIRYIEISYGENRNLVCPRDSCIGVYDKKSLEFLDREYFDKYKILIYNHYKSSKNTEIEKIKKEREVHRLMKEEREKFFLDSMPATVLKVANIAFSSKLKKLTKIQVKRESEYSSRISRVCFNLFCKGFIKPDMTCSKCSTVFCKDCEEPKKENHTCKKDVLESLKIIKNMIECPKCKVRVEKIDGCDAITCAVCNTNFWYTTGEAGESGNHGKFIQVITRDVYSVSNMYSEKISKHVFTKIKNIENSLSEKNIDDEAILNFFLKIQNGMEHIDSFSSLYSKMARKSMSDIINSKKLSAIEGLLREGKIQELEELFSNDDRPILQMKVIKNTGKFLFVEKAEEHYDLERASIDAKITVHMIINAIETGEVVANSYWEYK